MKVGSSWPTAAWGERGQVWRVDISLLARAQPVTHLASVMGDDYQSLSFRGAAGFLSRLEGGRLRVPEQFRLDMKEHIELARDAAA